MICRQCGREYPDEGKFCPACGTASAAPQQTYQPNNAQFGQQQTAQSTYYAPQNRPSMDPDTFFAFYPQYRPLGAWTYFGLGILYALPLIGLIFLLIHTFSDSNLVRRSYARSYWCGLILGVIITLIALLFGFGSLSALRFL